MDKEAVQMMSFQLVAHVGEATAHFTEAIKFAREGDFEAVDREIKAGDAEIIEAILDRTAAQDGDMIFFGADNKKIVAGMVAGSVKG